MKYIAPVYMREYNPNNPSVRAELEKGWGALSGSPIFPRMGHVKAHKLAGEYTHGGREQSVLQQLIEEGWVRPEGLQEEGDPFAGLFSHFLYGLGIKPGTGGKPEGGEPLFRGLSPKTPGSAHEEQQISGAEKASESAGNTIANVPNSILEALQSFIKGYGVRSLEVIGGALLVLFGLYTLVHERAS